MPETENSIEELHKLYTDALTEGHRTIESMAKQAIDQHLVSRKAAAESAELMKIARQILRGEPSAA